MGYTSFSLTGSQAGIITTSKHGQAEIEEITVYWPKILQEAKSVLTPRKYSYLTLVKPEVVDSENLVLF